MIFAPLYYTKSTKNYPTIYLRPSTNGINIYLIIVMSRDINIIRDIKVKTVKNP